MIEDWVEVELGTVCNINMGQSPPSATYNTDGNGLPFFQGKAEFTELHPIVAKWCSSPKKIANKGDILLSVRAPVGSTNIANQICAIGRGLAAISFTCSNPFLWYYLKWIEKKLDSQGTGTTFRAISGNILKSQIFPLPPLPIQRAIVSKLEALFSDLDNGIANLKKAQQQLKIYRQAVLKKAFDGKNLSESWIKEITEKVQIGPFGSQLHKEDYVNNGIPLINPMHIQDGKIIPRYDFSITVEKRNELPNYILETGDVIMGRRGEMGRCALVTDKEKGWFCGTGSLYLRPLKSNVFSPYLFYYMGSSIVKQYLTGSATGTTMMNLNKKIIQNAPIPVPSVLEQQKIVKEIESRLSVCDKVEESIILGLEKAEALRQSILKKAFEGKLLNEAEIDKCRQAADYEPASVLLERIKKEKVNGK